MWKEEDWKHLQIRDQAGSMMWMDGVHVKMIYDFLMANKFREVLEIGCWEGFSTSAIVQANKDGADIWGVLCDVKMRDHVKEIIKGQTIVTFEGASTEFLRLPISHDLAIVDGDHSLGVCMPEYDALIKKGVKSLIYHDVGGRGAPGPMWVLRRLMLEPGWRISVDDASREGMATDRGLMFATCDPEVKLPCDLAGVA